MQWAAVLRDLLAMNNFLLQVEPCGLFRLKHAGSCFICKVKLSLCRSQWPRCLRRQLCSLARLMESWIRIPLKIWMPVLCAFILCVVLCVGRGLTTGWSSVQGVLLNMYRIQKLKRRPRPNKGLSSHNIIIIIISCSCV
jgi:hypothetical protein